MLSGDTDGHRFIDGAPAEATKARSGRGVDVCATNWGEDSGVIWNLHCHFSHHRRRLHCHFNHSSLCISGLVKWLTYPSGAFLTHMRSQKLLFGLPRVTKKAKILNLPGMNIHWTLHPLPPLNHPNPISSTWSHSFKNIQPRNFSSFFPMWIDFGAIYISDRLQQTARAHLPCKRHCGNWSIPTQGTLHHIDLFSRSESSEKKKRHKRGEPGIEPETVQQLTSLYQ